MLKRKFGKTGMEVSAVGMGTWNIGNQWGELDDHQVLDTILAAYHSGITVFDTAGAYGIPGGCSEERLGRALDGIRENVVLISKFGNWAKRFGGEMQFTCADIVIEACHASLFRLQTNYLDVALCHLNDLKPEEVDPWLDGFEELKRRGQVRHYGISTDHLDVLKEFNRRGTCEVVELDYSLINKTPETNGMLDYCLENNIGVLVRGPLAQGILSGHYNRETHFTDTIRTPFNEGGSAREVYLQKMDRLDRVIEAAGKDNLIQTSLRYILSHPVCPVVIPGAKSPAQAKANAEAGSACLDEALYAKLKSC